MRDLSPGLCLAALLLAAGCGAQQPTVVLDPVPTAVSTAPSTTPSTAPPPTAPKPDPTPAPMPTPRVPTVTRGNFDLGETAHFTYFDVTVDKHRSARNGIEGGGIYGAHVTVCYTRKHPGANADGTTRTSTNPWKLGWAHGPDPTWWLPRTDLSNRWKPVYAERLLRVGQCNSGWISVDIRDSVFVANIGIRYAPADFAFRGTWTW